MKTPMNVRVTCLFTLVTLFLATPALAKLPEIGDLSEAEQTRLVESLDQGRKLYEQGRFKDALGAFQSAYKVFPHPDVLYRIAECQEKLGDDADAIASYELFLKQVPKAKEAMRIRGIINVLQARLDKRMQASLAVRTEPTGAEVIANGVSLGTTPLEAPLKAGDYQIIIKLKDHTPINETMKVEPGKTLALRYTLKSSASGSSPVIVKKDDTSKETQPGLKSPDTAPGFQLPENLTPWIVTGSGAVSLLTAGILWAVHSGAAGQVSAYDAEKGKRQRPDDYNDLVGVRNATGTTAVLFTIGAIGGLTAGAVLFALDGLEAEQNATPPKDGEDTGAIPKNVTISPWFAPESAGVGVLGRF